MGAAAGPKIMTKQIIEAGTSQTTPAAAPAAELSDKATPTTSKIMVLAVHQDETGKIVLTPIDIGHETNDQSDLSLEETSHGSNLLNEYRKNEEQMKEGLVALFHIFNRRLHREKFRTFENFCFAIFGTHRISDAVALKAKARVKQLQAELEATI